MCTWVLNSSCATVPPLALHLTSAPWGTRQQQTHSARAQHTSGGKSKLHLQPSSPHPPLAPQLLLSHPPHATPGAKRGPIPPPTRKPLAAAHSRIQPSSSYHPNTSCSRGSFSRKTLAAPTPRAPAPPARPGPRPACAARAAPPPAAAPGRPAARRRSGPAPRRPASASCGYG